MMGKGLGVWVIAELLFYFSANLINFALPMSVLMASLITMGNLAEHYELAAMKSGGLSLGRIMRPLVVLMSFVAVGAFFVANNVWPTANLKFKTLLYSIQQKEPTINLEENVFYNGIPGVSIRVDSKNSESNELFDVIIYDHRGELRGSKSVIRAERGIMQQTKDGRMLILTLFNGYSYDEQLEPRRKKIKTYPHVKSHFEKTTIRVDLAALAFEKKDEDLFRKAHEMMTITQLSEALDSFDLRIIKREENLKKYFNNGLLLFRDSLDVVMREKAMDSTVFTTSTLTQKLQILDRARRVNAQQIKHIQDSKKSTDDLTKTATRFLMEWHRKFFFAVSCLVLFFIGAPLGAIIRKGGIAWPAVIALVSFVVYYILTMIGEKMAKAGSVEPWLGMWLSTIVLLPLGVFLTWKATRDSSLMDKDFYLKLLKAFLQMFSKSKSNIESPPTLS